MVLGGTPGIGAALSRRLAADGASIGATFLDRSEDAERLSSALRTAGHHALMVQADVGDAGKLDAAIDRIVGHFGRLDILVSVAGTTIVGPLEAYPDDAFDRSFALNARAPFLAAKKAAGLMTEGGRIVTIGSIVADRMPGADGTLYAASKAAGPIDTERNPVDGPNAAASRSPLAIPQYGTPDEVAGLVAYLTSPEAGFVTGATYNIGGSWSA